MKNKERFDRIAKRLDVTTTNRKIYRVERMLGSIHG